MKKAACQAVTVQIMREGNLASSELPYAVLSIQTPNMYWHVCGKETVNYFFFHPKLQAAAIRPLGIQTPSPTQLEGLMQQT